MKQYVTQATVEETIHWKVYKASVVKSGDHYNLELRMNTQVDSYEDAIDFLEWTFECLKLVYHKVDIKPVDVWNAKIVASGSTENLPKRKRGRPRKNPAVATTKDLEKKSTVKKLSEFDPFGFIKSYSDKDELNQNCL